jgi:ABC-type dipeptide/oligopeptide/nickel transport system permease component
VLPFVARRLLALVPVLTLVLVIVFSLVRAIPGDPATVLLGPGATAEQIAALRLQLKLDRPALLQFTDYLSGLLRGDFGTSLKTGAPVLGEILQRLPATMELALLATLLAILVGVPLGVLSATRPNSLFDHLTRIVSLVGVSMPAFLLALILQLIFATWLNWLPVSGRTSAFITIQPITGFIILDALLSGDAAAAGNAAAHVVLPVCVLAAFLAATLGRYVRSAMLETLGEDYIRTARAKGLPQNAIIYRHALRKCPAAGADGGGPEVRRDAGRRHPDRDDLRLAGHRTLHVRGDPQPRFSGNPGRDAGLCAGLRHHIAAGRSSARSP